MNIYVGNLSYGAKEDELRDLFGQYGNVKSVKIITDRDTGRSRGFAFVEMDSHGEGEAAINGLNGTEYDGRALSINEARPKQEGGGGGRSGGGRGPGGGGRGPGGGGGRRF